MLVTRLRTFCTTLFNNNNIKVVIQMHAFQFDQLQNLYHRNQSFDISQIIYRTTLHADSSILDQFLCIENY